MTWTAPMTAVAHATFTAAQYNTNVRDNLLATEAALASLDGGGGLFVVTGANAIAERQVLSTSWNPVDSSVSVTYEQTNNNPSVTAVTGTSALVLWSTSIAHSVASGFATASVQVSGNTTVAASDNWQIMCNGRSAGNAGDNDTRRSMFHLFTGLTPGSNTFTMMCRTDGATAYYRFRRLTVVPL